MDSHSDSKIQDRFQNAVAAGWVSLILGLIPFLIILRDGWVGIGGGVDPYWTFAHEDWIIKATIVGLPAVAAIAGIFSLYWINRSILQFSHFSRPPLAIFIISVLWKFLFDTKWHGVSEILAFIFEILSLFYLIVVFDLVVKSVKQKKQKTIPALIGITLAFFEMIVLIYIQ